MRAVEHANGDEHVAAAIEQIITPETLQLPHQRQEAVLHASNEFLRRNLVSRCIF